MPTHHSPLTIAKESLAMSEKTGDRMFQRMAIGFMALTGIATVLHAIREFRRDVQPKREYARATVQVHTVEQEPEQGHHEAPSQSWVKKARVSDRHAEGERTWSDSMKHQGQGRHH